MAGLDPKIAEFMKTYGVDADEIWLLPGGKSHAVKHKALERIAMQKGMVVESLKVLALNQLDKTAAMEAIVRLGDARVITTGEAAPANNKNAYVLAMAEKRALDRAYLKLLMVHGDIYSDAEADEFIDPGQGEKGRLLASSQYARNEASKLMLSMRECNSLDMLTQWGKAHREEIRAQPEKHAEAIREAYAELADELRASAE
jgi:hypothetical protein